MNLTDDLQENSPPAPPCMRLDRLYVNNFKSLVDFELALAPFTCLVGLNGSGKSTVLQAIDFSARLFRGGMQGWLKDRQWDAVDLNSKLAAGRNIRVRLSLSQGDKHYRWKGSFNRSCLRCTQEILVLDKRPIFSVRDGRYSCYGVSNTETRVASAPSTKIEFRYTGSVLSQLNPASLPDAIRPFVHFMSKSASLDALSPQLLRKRTQESYGQLGLGGESLSAFLHEMPGREKQV